MMNRYDQSGYGRNDYGGGGGGDYGMFGGYPNSAPPPTGVPSPFGAGGPPPPSLLSMSAVPPSLLGAPTGGPTPIPVQGGLGPPPSILPSPAHMQGPGAGVAAGSAGMNTSGVNTNSRHPLAVKARVFVGNLNTNAVTREELEQVFRRFGEVLAVSMHRGYGFVQYALEYEARNAISFTDGMILGGQRLDVNLASEPKTGRESKAMKRQASEPNTPDFSSSSKRSKPGLMEGKSSGSTSTSSANPKPLFPHKGDQKLTTTSATKPTIVSKPAPSNIVVIKKETAVSPAKISMAPAKTMIAIKTETNGGGGASAYPVSCTNAPGVTETSADILICGQCRAMFSDVAVFLAHRKDTGGAKCSTPTTDTTAADVKSEKKVSVVVAPSSMKPEGEPETLLCFMCEQPFENSWKLIDHLSKGHGIIVYHTSKSAADAAEKGQATKEKILAAKTGVTKSEDEEKEKEKPETTTEEK